METPYRVYGGLQDNDVWMGPGNSLNPFGIGNRDWHSLTIGDGFVTVVDPSDVRVVYGETQDGRVSRIDQETGGQRSIGPRTAPGEPALRWAWNTPFLISPHDPNALLMAAQKVFRSTDRGDTWRAISPDLTGDADRDTLSLMGVKGSDFAMSKNDGVSSWPTLVSLTESPRTAGLYYAGSDDGRVHVSRDGGATWEDLTGRFPGLPVHAVPEDLVASAFAEGVVYATFDDHGADDYAPYVFSSTDYGATWVSLASTLPANRVVNCLTEDPRNADVLYLGTESGLLVSLDRGAHWTALKNQLPTVPIDEITIQPRDNDMLLATHGRSIWILDDLAPIQEAARAARAQAYLFGIDPAVEFLVKNDFAGYPGDRAFWGRNPEAGASLTWYLGEAVGEVRLTIRDASGSVVRAMEGEEMDSLAATGLHRVSWDLRHQPLDPQPSDAPGDGRPRRGSPGPFVLPGEYSVQLAVDGRPVGTRTVRVSADPRLRIATADLEALHDAALSLHRLQAVMNDAGLALDSATAQVRTARELLDASSSPPAALMATADTLAARVAALTERLGSVPRFGRGGGDATLRTRIPALRRALESWTEGPTSAQLREVAADRAQVAELVSDVNVASTQGLPDLYDAIREAKLDPPARTPIPSVIMR